MRISIKVSFLLIFTILFSINFSASEINKPDFAYPKQVVQQSESNLNKALKDGNGNAVVRSLIDYSIAQLRINTDSIHSVINKIEHVVAKEKNPCTKALLNTLLCQIYTNIYLENKYNIDRRTNVSSITPLDITQWSKKDFENKVFLLCDNALQDADAIKKSELRNYGDLITYNNLTFIYYPTLYDFIANRIIENIENLNGSDLYTTEILPLDKFLTSSTSNSNSFYCRVYSLYKDVLAFHLNDIAPLIHWDLERIENSYNTSAIIVRENNNSASQVSQRDNAVKYLYNTYKQFEYASLALIYQWDKLYQNTDSFNKSIFYNLLKKRLSQFPAFSGNCEIRNILNEIEQQKIMLKFPHQIIPNDTLLIDISNTNCKSLKVEILRLPDDIGYKNRYSYKNGVAPQVYKSFVVNCDSIIPFSINQNVKTTISQPGYYSIIAYNNDIKKDLNNLEIIYCSELTSVSANSFSEESRLWVINAKTGKVINNADINIFEHSSLITKNKPLFSTKSTRDGILNFEKKNKNTLYYAISKGDDKYAPYSSLYIPNSNNDTTWTDQATCFTALPLYHPGDTVAWSAVVYSYKYGAQKLAANKTYTISFRDANYMQIDTAIVITDNWGRIEGKFSIPTDRLTGNYSINIIGRFNRNIASTSFMVSDYKLPTFDVKLSDITKQENGKCLISGEVRSFSGFALSDATIYLNLQYREYQFYYHQPFKNILNDTTTTDINGKFSFSIALPNINTGDKAIYNAEIIATSPNGESQKANRTFTNGNSFYIFAYGLEAAPIEVTKQTKLNVALNTLSNTSVDGTIYYSIINDYDKEIKKGYFSTTNPIVDWSGVASGKYKIKLHSIAPTATDTVTSEIRLYRLSDALPPINKGIWLQHEKYTITNDNSVEFYYGSTFSDGDILYLLYDDKKIYDQRWIKAKAGIHKSRILLPKDINEATVKLIAINDYNCYHTSAKTNRTNANKGIKITAQSFRDKIIPGSDEQWTFNVSDTNGQGKESAMILDMYSIAIEKIKHHSFNLQFYKPSRYVDFEMPYFFNNSTYIYSKLSNNHQCVEITKPRFNMYGESLIGNNHYPDRIMLRTYSSNNLSKTMSKGINGVAIEESADSDIINEEVETKKQNIAAVSSTEDASNVNIPLRENETPLAFFRPMLTSDTLGNLTCSFTVPNANTTWLFNAIAYNKDLEVAHFARKVLANKPIMVQPNMPRFLRNGDKATIKASVMNNSDSALIITTIIELFDPTTAKNITTHRQIDTIPASQSILASIEITAPNDVSMIGYRIKSFCENFGDGEQSLIPMLPATSSVIESTTFYIGAHEHSYTQKLPSMPSEAKVTLEFCENPTWYAVTALPGLNKNQSRTSISAAMAIYSVAITDGIIRQNPQIANALYEWQHSDKTDSTLVSMLSRNQDLKNMLLSATPWMQDAETDTERMARLSLLFNKAEIKTSLDKNIHLLATLQRNGGGWAWIAESNEASLWASLSILENLGHLKKLGFLPKDQRLNSMIENALKYIDAEYVQQFKKYPKGDYSLYVLIRDMFPEYKQSTAAKRVTNATIQQIIGNWKQYSLVKKATSAIILNNNGYNSSARGILNSLNEFSQSTPARGMWWPAVENNNSWNFDKILSHTNIMDAYIQITPNDSNIDLMRQWLILNKEANDWGASSTTGYVIYTLLNSGSRWTNKAFGCEITLNNENITPSHFDNITGYIKSDISNLSPSGKKLTIAKHVSQPAWGAIYQQYNADMSDIKSVAGNDISIEKTLLKKVDNKWVIASDYNVGDVIRIQLTIKAKRDIDYVTITDERAACLEPTEQLPRPIFYEGIFFYRENRNDATNIFVTNLPKGTYLLSYDMYVNNEGEFASGIATIQSQYAPQITAHSAGNTIKVMQK